MDEMRVRREKIAKIDDQQNELASTQCESSDDGATAQPECNHKMSPPPMRPEVVASIAAGLDSEISRHVGSRQVLRTSLAQCPLKVRNYLKERRGPLRAHSIAIPEARPCEPLVGGRVDKTVISKPKRRSGSSGSCGSGSGSSSATSSGLGPGSSSATSSSASAKQGSVIIVIDDSP